MVNFANYMNIMKLSSYCYIGTALANILINDIQETLYDF